MWKSFYEYLVRTLTTLKWAKEFKSTDLPKTPFTSTTKNGRLVSTNNGEWIYDFMDKSEADHMNAKLERIEENSSTIITLMMTASKEDVIDLCRTWDKAVNGDVYSWLKISSFVEHLVDNMKEHLEGDS
jgi:hypothetical protein